MIANRFAAVVAVATGAADDAHAISTAAALARRHAAVAHVVAHLPDRAMMLSGWGNASGIYLTPEVLQSLTDADNETRKDIARMAKDISARDGLAWGPGSGGARMILDDAEGAFWSPLERALPLADLTIFGRSAEQDSSLRDGPLAQTLMTSRSPALVVRDAPLATGKPVAVAWDGSLEAGRAVRAARPLLVEASEVVILQDLSELSPERREAADPARLIAYLELCGVVATRAASVEGGGHGPALVAAANRYSAEILVAGAYGHTRLGEWMLGGATRAFLEAKDAPHLFLAH
ncbi:MAG: universal stress protein [Proteobacteria bacterium]|nr:universal stress protein [Pseudomonadota bacterium]